LDTRIPRRIILKPLGLKMRVLHFAPRLCWPLDTGAKLRNYHLARELSRRAEVTLVAFREDRGDDGRTTDNLEDFYEQVVSVKRGPGYTPSKIVRGALGRTPLSLLNYTTDAMRQALENVLSQREFDIVQIESIHLMAYLPTIRAARNRPLIICDWHNIESELMQRYSERERSFLRKKYAQKTARQLGVLEQRATHDFDAHVTVSDRDRQRLRQLNPAARVVVIENGVDSSHYSDEEIENAHAAWPAHNDGRRRRILFVGSMDYHANIDGVVDFAREVWPGIHAAQPDFVFTIVGRDPATSVRELSSIAGIEVTGTVDDVRPYYREAIAAVVPLKVGGGSRLKIVEAMAAGVPVVSTTLGAEGLEVEHEKNILIANTNQELAEAINRVVGSADAQQHLRTGGRALVAARYDWSRLGATLFETYTELLAARSAASNQ
jgi:sugar transferase (PEP-CTERM/EpsH1 system associated)